MKAFGFVATPQAMANVAPSDDTYQVVVVLQRNLSDDLALFEDSGVEVTWDDLAVQVAKELQVAYDEGMAGMFEVARVARDLTGDLSLMMALPGQAPLDGPAVGSYYHDAAGAFQGPFASDLTRKAHQAVIAPGGPLTPSGGVEEPGAAYPIFGQDEDGDARETVAAWVTPADVGVARHVLAQAVGPDGRSGFNWFRFENGDLVLGVYPRGETYLATDADPRRDDRAPVPLEEIGLANLNPAEWPIHRLKDGYHACVNHDLALASTSFLTPEAMRRNAEAVRVTPATVARMRQRYLEKVCS